MMRIEEYDIVLPFYTLFEEYGIAYIVYDEALR